MHVDIPYTSIMTSFIFFEKLESAFGPAVPNTPSCVGGPGVARRALRAAQVEGAGVAWVLGDADIAPRHAAVAVRRAVKLGRSSIKSGTPGC